MHTVEIDFEKARKDFEALCDRVTGDCEVVYISREGEGNDVAMIAADELRAVLETLHLLKNRANAERLWDAIDEVQKGKGGTPMTIEELKAAVGL